MFSIIVFVVAKNDSFSQTQARSIGSASPISRNLFIACHVFFRSAALPSRRAARLLGNFFSVVFLRAYMAILAEATFYSKNESRTFSGPLLVKSALLAVDADLA
jgi:hypothetical protein